MLYGLTEQHSTPLILHHDLMHYRLNTAPIVTTSSRLLREVGTVLVCLCVCVCVSMLLELMYRASNV